MSADPPCIPFAIFDIIENGVNAEVAEESLEFFTSSFDNPKPIIENIGDTIVGFGERTLVYIFLALFIIFIIVIFYMLSIGMFDAGDAIILSIIILILFIVITGIYIFTTGSFVEAEADVIFNSLSVWLTAQEAKIPSAINTTACFYVSEREKVV